MAHRQTISDLAYHLWNARGRPEGSSEVDWREAERQVTGRLTETTAELPVNGAAPHGQAHASSEAPAAQDAPPAALPDDPARGNEPAGDPPSNAKAKSAGAGKKRKR